MKVLALDFGGSSVKYGIVDENAVITESGKLPAPLSSADEFTDTVKSLYEKYKDTVSGIGISLPGNIDPETGVLFGSGVYTELYGKSVTDIVREKCNVPVTIENDGKCGALSEAWKGSLQHCNDGIVIILGSGIAGGLIKDHKIHSGKGFNAGEFSYMITTPGDYSMLSSACMSVGMLGVTYKLCKLKNLDLSVQDSSPTLLFLDSLFSSKYPASTGEPKKIKADGKQFFSWVNQGDEDALQVYKEFMESLGALAFNAQICFAPDRIVIGGGLSMEERVIPDLQAEIDKYYAGYGLGDKMRAEIVRSTYRSESNLYGATYNFIIRNT
ncbi:MAG: ROK family protein [Clostridiales bacterium]|nr:ROK family protein [Clostridiales bacterium]